MCPITVEIPMVLEYLVFIRYGSCGVLQKRLSGMFRLRVRHSLCQERQESAAVVRAAPVAANHSLLCSIVLDEFMDQRMIIVMVDTMWCYILHHRRAFFEVV